MKKIRPWVRGFVEFSYVAIHPSFFLHFRYPVANSNRPLFFLFLKQDYDTRLEVLGINANVNSYSKQNGQSTFPPCALLVLVGKSELKPFPKEKAFSDPGTLKLSERGLTAMARGQSRVIITLTKGIPKEGRKPGGWKLAKRRPARPVLTGGTEPVANNSLLTAKRETLAVT